MDDEQAKPRPEPPRETSPRDDVHVVGSPVRCPFCHEDVAIEGEWSACSRCLARHHEACWREGRRCAACGHDGAVRHEHTRRRPLPVGVVYLAVLLSAVVAVMAVMFMGAQVLPHFRRREVIRASEPLAPTKAPSKPASRQEKDGALVVEDGRGNFVITFEAEDAVVFGFDTVLISADAERVVVRRDLDARWVTSRPLPPLLAYRTTPAGLNVIELARPGMTAREIAVFLRQTRPPDLDLEELLRRAQGD